MIYKNTIYTLQLSSQMPSRIIPTTPTSLDHQSSHSNLLSSNNNGSDVNPHQSNKKLLLNSSTTTKNHTTRSHTTQKSLLYTYWIRYMIPIKLLYIAAAMFLCSISSFRSQVMQSFIQTKSSTPVGIIDSLSSGTALIGILTWGRLADR